MGDVIRIRRWPMYRPGSDYGEYLALLYRALTEESSDRIQDLHHVGHQYMEPYTAKGDIMVGLSAGDIDMLHIGTAGQVLVVSGGTPVWAEPSAATAHSTLSLTHTDSTAAAVVRGDIIIGSGATPKWTRLAAGATTTYLAGGTEPSWATLNQAAVAGLTTADSPSFVTVKCSGLTDNYIPYHGSDAAGLANSRISQSGGVVSIAGPLSVGTHDGINSFLYINRHSAVYPYGSLVAGSVDNDTGVGLMLDYRDSTGVQKNGLYLTSGGSVLVGATATVGSEKLRVDGDVYFDHGLTIAGLAGAVQATAGVISAGTLPVSVGGSGATTLADGGLVIGNGTGAVEVVAPGLTTQILVGGGLATAPVWGSDLPTAVTVGTKYIYRADGTDVPVADGGTGASTLATNGILYGNGASAIGATAIGAQYNILTVGATPFVPAWSGYLISGTTGGKTTLAVSNTKTLTLTATDDFNLTIAATASISGTNTGDNAANSLYDIGSDTQAWGAKLDSISALASAAGWLHNDGAGVFAYSTPTAANVGADPAGTAAGAVSDHAALTTGIHGLAITAGQTLTVTTGGTLGSAAYTATTAYDAAGTGHTEAAAHVTAHEGTYTHSDIAANTSARHSAITLAASAGVLMGLSTQEISLDNQTANYIFAGPTSGAAAAPTFRAMVAADLGTGLTPEFVSIKLSGLSDGYIPYRVTATDVLGNSPIYTDGTNVGVGTATATERFVVANGEAHFDWSSSVPARGSAISIFSNANASCLASNRYYDGQTRYARAGGSSLVFFDVTSGATAGDVKFQTAASGVAGAVMSTATRMTLKQGGALLIGATAAVGSEKLRVNGAIYTDTTIRCKDLTDGYIPCHVSDAVGLANSPIYTDGTKVGIGGSPSYGLHVNNSVASDAMMMIQNSNASQSTILRIRPGQAGTQAGIAIGSDTADLWFLYRPPSSTSFRIYDVAGSKDVISILTGGSVLIGAKSTASAEKLHVNGQIKITGGSPTAGYVLTCDANGLATWEAVVGDGSGMEAHDVDGAYHTGTLSVAKGGTGAGTLTDNGVLYGNATAAVGATAEGATLQVLIGTTGSAPSWSASPNLTAVHATTILADHIGEHTAGHSVMFDGGIKLAGNTAGVGTVKYISPGADVLCNAGGTAAVDTMVNGDCIILGAGAYTQTVPIKIPVSPSVVTNFSILGRGPGVTTITYSADVNGIETQTADASYRIENATLSGFSLINSSGGVSTTKYGIYLWGDWTNDTTSARLNIENVSIHYGTGTWLSGICLVDSYNFNIHNCYVRPSANSGVSVASSHRAVSSNVATIGTATAHKLIAGDTATISGMTDSAYDGRKVVVSAPDATHFTYSLTHANEGETADAAGTITGGVSSAADGITLLSCMNGAITNTRVTGARVAFDISKAADGLIKDSTKHGTEGTKIVGSCTDFCGRGVVLGDKSYAINIDSCEFALCFHDHIYETNASGVAYGFHVISHCVFDANSDFSGTAPASVYLKQPGSIITGNQFKGSGAPTVNHHYVYLDTDSTIVSGNIFRVLKDGYAAIYVNNHNTEVITGNHMGYSTGYFIDGTCDSSVITDNLYVHMNGGTDRFDVVNASGKTENLEL